MKRREAAPNLNVEAIKVAIASDDPHMKTLEKKPEASILYVSASGNPVMSVKETWRPRMKLPSGKYVYRIPLGQKKDFDLHYLVQTKVIWPATTEDEAEIKEYQKSLEDARKAKGLI